MPPKANAAAEGAVLEPEAPKPAAVVGEDQAIKDMAVHFKAQKRGKLNAAPKTPLDAPLPEGLVRVRILPMGDNKVHTGAMDPTSLTDKFPKHRRGEIVVLPFDVADAQEKRGHVEILA